MDNSITISVFGSLSDITKDAWDACANPDGGIPEDPFTTHRFLKALEDSGSVGEGTGWYPRYIKAERGSDLLGVLPCYAKSHSQGEYIFDHSWAHAYENAGGRYYPKLQVSVPFTPATGRRFLAKPGEEAVAAAALLQGAQSLAAQNNLSGIHMTFCTEAEYDFGPNLGLMQRLGQQFHWVNNDYPDFDSFLTDLSSRKRKNIRKERAAAHAFGGEIYAFTGDALRPEHWDAFWRFYQDTGMRKWGSPYLTRSFFDIAQETLRDDMLLVMAKYDGRWVAGALNFLGRDAIFGRYWGCVEHHNCMHFELCYYQAIDFAIAQGLKRVEAGAQGEHKLARGYMPAPTYSLHWMLDPRFGDVIDDYLRRERAAVDDEIEILTAYGPFKKPNEDDYAREND
ncbi:MAG: GNAT family N-acetyltransferase [Pseudomonadota bacterium]